MFALKHARQQAAILRQLLAHGLLQVCPGSPCYCMVVHGFQKEGFALRHARQQAAMCTVFLCCCSEREFIRPLAAQVLEGGSSQQRMSKAVRKMTACFAYRDSLRGLLTV